MAENLGLMRRKNRKRFTVALAAAALFTAMSVTANAQQIGWQQDEIGWYYENLDEERIRESWLEEDKNWYYLDVYGYRATGWYLVEKDTYYFDFDGKMQTGWTKVEDTWYHFSESGKMDTGWLNLNDKWYYLDSDGKMQTGWLESNQNWYYFNSSGEMSTDWTEVNGSWYYLDLSGKMRTGWLELDQTWYYLDSSGKMQTGWLNLNQTWYYFDANGKMQTNWIELDQTWYYLDSDGKMRTGWLDLNQTWYYLNASGKMQTGWLEQNQVWYYLHENGTLAKDTWIDDSYYIDDSGVWIEERVRENEISIVDTQIPPADSNENMTEDMTEETIEENTETITSDEEEISESEIDATQYMRSYVKKKLGELKEKYPDGMYWNHMGYPIVTGNWNYYSDTITNIPCDHGNNGTSYCNSYINKKVGYVIGLQCDGFARKLSDEIFGVDAPAMAYTYNFDAIKEGDYLRYNNTHAVIVIEKTENEIKVAECNIGGTCIIRWGRTIKKTQLDHFSIMSCFTRY